MIFCRPRSEFSRKESTNGANETETSPCRQAIELYNRFIHGEISRRDFMDGLQRFAVGGLAVAAMLDALEPNYALGLQVSRNDDRIMATNETVPSPEWKYQRLFCAPCERGFAGRKTGKRLAHPTAGCDPVTSPPRSKNQRAV